jgi:hypothetical protein
MGETLSKIYDKLKKIKIDGASFELVSKYSFPDGYVVKSDIISRVVIVKKNKQPIGIFEYSINFSRHVNNEIEINYVQGIKREGNSNPVFIKKMPWIDFIIESFIFSCADLIFSQKYNIQLKLDGLKYNKNRSESIKKNIDGYLEDIKEINKEISDCKKEKNFDKIKLLEKELNRIMILINGKKSVLKLYGYIRDRYFNNYGKLNLNKKRVKKILELYQIKKNKAITRKKIIARKRNLIIKNRKI